MDVIWQMLVGAVVAFVCGWAGAWVRSVVAARRELFPEATDAELISMRRLLARKVVNYGGDLPTLAAGTRRNIRKIDRALEARGITYNHRNGEVT